MTSYEIMTSAIEFKKLRRLPVIFPKFGVTDMAGIGVLATTYTPRGDYEFDEWG